MFECMRYGERLQKARTHAGLTQRQLAERIDNVCTQENISKLERGTATGSEFTVQFANACGVRAMWLASGSGDMLPDTYSTSDPTLGQILQVLEPRAEYIKSTAYKDVLSLCELADHVLSGKPDENDRAHKNERHEETQHPGQSTGFKVFGGGYESPPTPGKGIKHGKR